MIGGERDETLQRVYDEQLDEFVWARSLNPNPLRDAGRRLLGRISGTSFRAPVDDDIASKRRRDRAAKGIITVGGM